MRSKVTVVLLFLNVVLFYYIFQYEQKWRAERAQLEARRRVLGSEAASIDAFTRTSPTAPTLAAEKRGETWWLTQPFEWPANPNAISRILSELQLLEHETSFTVADLERGGQALADYGLAEPALTFSFRSGGREFPLRVGDRTEIGNRLYVRSPDGARIHVVGRSLADTLGLPVEQLRTDTLFTIPVFEVRSLAVQTAAPANLRIRLRRDGPRWLFETPILARATKQSVESAINSLNSLQARRFLDPRESDPGRTGLATPQLRLTLEGNSRRETLLLGAAVNPPAAGAATVELFAKIEDKAAVFITAFPTRLLEDLRTAQETLRDPRILDFEPAQVTGLALAAPDRPEMDLQRLESAADRWQLVTRASAGSTPRTRPADSGVVGDVIARLQLLAATRFLSDAPSAADLENYGFNRPVREYSLALRTGGGLRGDEPTTLTLQIGARPGERTAAYARLTNAPYVYQIEPDLIEDVPVTPLHFRERLLRDLPAGARLTHLVLTDLADESVMLQLAAPPDSALTREQPGMDEPDATRREALATLLAEVRRLRAQRFLAEEFDRAGAALPTGTVPWRYRLDVTLALSGGSAQGTISTLFLTERLGGTTQVAGTEEFDGLVFEVNQPLLDALFTLTYGRQHDPGPPADAPGGE